MITVNRPVTRQMSEVDYRTRQPFVLQLVPGGRLVRIKTKGSRTWYTVTIQQIWQAGARNRLIEVRQAKDRRRAEFKALGRRR